MLKKLLYGLLVAVMTFAFVSCEKSDDDGKSDNRHEQEEEKKDDDEEKKDDDEKEEEEKYDYYTATGLYLGVTGFNSDLHHYSESGFRLLNLTSCYSFKQFVSSLQTDDGTILYYAMDNALSQLEKSRFPDDLKNVSIITFTDGLDQGSSVKNPQYQSAAAYLEAIQNRIRTTKVNGLNINAYSIGLKGQDITNETQFKSNLDGLASENDDKHVMEVSNMTEVNDKFMQLAASLYKENTSQSLKLTIPQPYNNTRIRFTFDIDSDTDAANSACYIEGVFNNGSLTQIEYKGLTSSSGSSVKGESAGSINISFTFEEITLEAGNELTASRIKQWEWTTNSNLWQANSEFNPDKSTETTIEMQSAAIILLLDCSSSLGDDLEKVKQAARNFIEVLSETSHEKEVAQVRFRKTGTYHELPRLALFNQQKEILAEYNFGESTGTSSYFRIPAGTHYPAYYYAGGNPGYGYLLKSPYTYDFDADKKYTITCSEPSKGYYSYNIECDN